MRGTWCAGVPSFQIRGSWYVMLRHEDQVLLRSRELHAEQACEDIASRIRCFARSAERFEQHTATNGGHYFTLHDDKGNVLGRSPTLPSREACERAIVIVQELAQSTERPIDAPRS